MNYYLSCISCGQTYKGDEILYRCSKCRYLLEVQRSDWDELKKIVSKKLFDNRLGSKKFPYQSGVWRYKELVLPIPDQYIVSKLEGNTNLYLVGSDQKDGLSKIGKFAGLKNLYLKHEGDNPTGSFKDRGMTVGISVAKMLGAKAVACASTGNTSASLASYATQAGIKCFVFIPEGKISYSKLSQSIAYGAKNIQIKGDFDTAMKLVQKVAEELNIYLLNSINPFRIEGQKTIAFELLQQLNWQVPDYIVVPAGNLGNTSAIGKGLLELQRLDLIKRLPKIVAVQAKGANSFYQSFLSNFKKKYTVKADTVASAIRIGNPVSFLKAASIIKQTNGLVEEVTDQEILDSKAIIDSAGIGCEPASAASLAGIKKLVAKKTIKANDKVAGILTGNLLKDPDTTMSYHLGKIASIKSHFKNEIIHAKPEIGIIREIIQGI